MPRTTHEAAKELLRDPFHLLRNKLDEPDGLWWLSPSPQVPAHKFGKIAFTPIDEESFFVGFYVEKGYGNKEAAKGDPKGSKRLMDSSWLWHDFVRALQGGQIESIVAAAEGRAGRPLTIKIDVSHSIAEPGFVSFKHQANGTLSVIPTNPPPASVAQIAQMISGCTSLAQLGQRLGSQDSRLEWLWIDIHLGFLIQRGPWDRESVWNYACAPWQRWFRSSSTPKELKDYQKGSHPCSACGEREGIVFELTTSGPWSLKETEVNCSYCGVWHRVQVEDPHATIGRVRSYRAEHSYLYVIFKPGLDLQTKAGVRDGVRMTPPGGWTILHTVDGFLVRLNGTADQRHRQAGMIKTQLRDDDHEQHTQGTQELSQEQASLLPLLT